MKQGMVIAGCFAIVMAGLAASAQAQTVTVTAQLWGASENPVVVSGSTGNATVTIDRAARRITYVINVYNLPTGLTASHIHAGVPGGNGPVILNFNFAPLVNSSNDFQMSGVLTEADLRPAPALGINSFDDAMFAIASGGTYANVHTTANTGGEIRGQLCPESVEANVFNKTAACIATK